MPQQPDQTNPDQTQPDPHQPDPHQPAPNQPDQIKADHHALRQAPLAIDVIAGQRVTFATEQAGLPLVERLSITNRGSAPVAELRVRIRLENDACEPWSALIDRIGPGETYNLHPRELRLSAATLAQRTEGERTRLRVDVESDQGPAAHASDLDLLPFDHWPGAASPPELLAAFVTPNHPSLVPVLNAARAALGSRTGRDALDGYQSGARQRAAAIGEACFAALHGLGLGYVNPPASFESQGQRVRLADRLLREQLGGCLDLSLALAGLWEQCGLHPLLILVEGHAFPALWTHETHLAEASTDDPSQVRNLVALGEVVPVEATVLTHARGTFEEAVRAARQRLENPGDAFVAIDVRAARKAGVRPLPLRVSEGVTTLDLEARDVIATDAPAARLDEVALADRAGQRQPSQRPPRETGSQRIDRWQSRLLDLSLANRLVSFRESKRTLQLTLPDLDRVENRLAAEDSFVLHHATDASLGRGAARGTEAAPTTGLDPASDPSAYPPQALAFLRDQQEAGRLYSALPQSETQARLLMLYRLSRAASEETGSSPLYLALGMLRWFETPSSEQALLAPIILLPVELTRSAAGSGYRYELWLGDEPLRPNVTLIEKLRRDFGLDTTGLDELPEDESGLDLAMILRNFRQRVRDVPRWEVRELSYLGLFSFAKFLMWRDLRENMDRLRKNRLVQHLVNDSAGVFDPRPMPRPEDLDDQTKPSDLLCTRDADSSQLAAVRAASESRTFVLEGPPGTGKSQTIANIVADSVARGKRVLFVAEKLAALTVVRSRLEKDGLGPLCLELHSAKASKKEVLAQLDVALRSGLSGSTEEWRAACASLSSTRSALNAYVRALHQPRPSGETLHQALSRLASDDRAARRSLPQVQSPDLGATSEEQLAVYRRLASDLASRGAAVHPVHEHPLRGVGQTRWRLGLVEEAERALSAARAALESVRASAAAFLDSCSPGLSAAFEQLTQGQLGVLAELGPVACQGQAIPREFLHGPDASQRRRRARELVALGRERDAARDRLLATYREEFFQLEHLPHLDAVKRASQAWFVPKFFQTRAIAKGLRPYARGELPPLPQLASDLEDARIVRQRSEQLRASQEGPLLLAGRWHAGGLPSSSSPADWSELEARINWCETIASHAEALLRGGPERTAALAASATPPTRSTSAGSVASPESGEKAASPATFTPFSGTTELRPAPELHQAAAALAPASPASSRQPAPASRTAGASVLDAILALVARGDAARSAPLAAAFSASWRELVQCWQRTAGDDILQASDAVGGADPFALKLREVLDRWMGGLESLNDWCAWCAARNLAASNGLGEFVAALGRGDLTPRDVPQCFERSYADAWFRVVANSVPAVRDFNAAQHGATIAEFRSLDTRVIQQTRHAVEASAAARRPDPSADVSASSEMGILRRELQKKSRHMATRKLIEAMPNLLPRLKPCFLMSPLSVAQYLDASLPPFDLVIFDEASQIPVWDSIGAIARGSEVIVVGDSKQLPPTAFFTSGEPGEDDEPQAQPLVDDMESILKECNASGIPSLWLKWHYRSKHESLIAFSNYHYYENQLHTFPAPEDRSPGLGVTFRHVAAGVYDKGNTRTNRVEAEQVVDHVVALLNDSARPDSIGVVTFNQQQQTLIEDLLDQKRREHPDLEKHFARDAAEPVFVKNLENVQGDERDTIIFSVGFGPDQSGKVSMNFGPLNQDGGERRLNVAVTRARRRLVVFSTLRSEQIDLRRTQALGVRHFKTFLAYAERGPQAIAEAVRRSDSGSSADQPNLEKAVRAALLARGCQVDLHVGCAGYRVDLGVRDPSRPGRYILGIECDGSAYSSGKTARDRDRLRQSVLESLGWTLARVWSLEWYASPARCLASLEAALQAAQASPLPEAMAKPSPSASSSPAVSSPVVSSPTPAPVAGEPATPALERAAPPTPKPRPHKKYEALRPTRSDASIDLYAPGPKAVDALVRIVRAEHPIVDELAMHRLAFWLGLKKTERFRTRFEECLAAAQASGAIHAETQGIAGALQRVLWPDAASVVAYADAMSNSAASVRVPGDDEEDWRDLHHIPLIERVAGVLLILRQQVALPRAELQREICTLLGGTRVTPRAREICDQAIQAAIVSGKAKEQQGSIALA
ncbi:MAG: DUF4011 domain-containing protein [Planctomycetota bacterium]|nr:DUF4011 domain-containing protein [Planctomycetota bacterium]